MADHHVVERVERSDSGSGMVIGLLVVVLLVAVIGLFFIFGGPARLTGAPAGQTNVNVPSQSQPSAPNINVPGQIDVNVNQPAPQAPQGQQAPQAPAQGQGR